MMELNNSLIQRVSDLEHEKGIQLKTMATIIAKNEELQHELAIVTRALELRDNSQLIQDEYQ